MKRLIQLFFIAATAFAQGPSPWNPNKEQVWDMNNLLTVRQKSELSTLLQSRAAVKKYVIISADFTRASIGEDWASKVAQIKPTDPQYYPAGIALDLACAKYHVGEKDPHGSSLAIWVTPLRSDPRKRWASSSGAKTTREIPLENINQAYQAFADRMRAQHDRLPAKPEVLSQAILAALKVIQK